MLDEGTPAAATARCATRPATCSASSQKAIRGEFKVWAAKAVRHRRRPVLPLSRLYALAPSATGPPPAPNGLAARQWPTWRNCVQPWAILEQLSPGDRWEHAAFRGDNWSAPAGLLTDALPGMPMLAARLHASRHHGRPNPSRPAVESRIAAQRDVADAAHPPRFTHLARLSARRGPGPGSSARTASISVMNEM